MERHDCDRLNRGELLALIAALREAPHLGDENERWTETACAKLKAQLELLGP